MAREVEEVRKGFVRVSLSICNQIEPFLFSFFGFPFCAVLHLSMRKNEMKAGLGKNTGPSPQVSPQSSPKPGSPLSAAVDNQKVASSAARFSILVQFVSPASHEKYCFT